MIQWGKYGFPLYPFPVSVSISLSVSAFFVFKKSNITAQNRKNLMGYAFEHRKSLLQQKRNRQFLFNGAGEVTRTPDLRITSALLYRLSYASI